MKKLILTILPVLAIWSIPLNAYRLQVVYSMGGGLTATGVRTIITYGSGNSVTTAKDSTITTTISATTSPITKNWYLPDSLVAYSVTKIYYSAPDTFVEQVENVLPIEFEQLLRARIADIDTGVTVVLDSLDDQVWASAGSVSLDAQDIEDIAAAVVAGIGSEAGTGINTVTLYARDTVNGAFIPGVYVTAEAGAEHLTAQTGVNGYATFNCNSATYTFNALGSPYTWVPFTRAVAGNITDTITGGGVTVVASSSPGMCTVYGQIDRNGVAAQGVWVEIALTRPDTLTIDSSFIELKTKVVTNSSGLWSASVYYLTGDTRNFYYTYKDAYGRVLTFRPTTTGSHSIKNILVDKP